MSRLLIELTIVPDNLSSCSISDSWKKLESKIWSNRMSASNINFRLLHPINYSNLRSDFKRVKQWREQLSPRSILTDINHVDIFAMRITRVGCCIVATVTHLQTSELFMAPKETVPESSGLHVTEMLSQIEIRSCHLRGGRVANLEHAHVHVETGYRVSVPCTISREGAASWRSFNAGRNVTD